MPKRHRTRIRLLPDTPLLISESCAEFESIRWALEQEIRPGGPIEHVYVHDIASLVWEILRLRRWKAAILNTALRDALRRVLNQVLKQPGESLFAERVGLEDLIKRWFSNAEARAEVLDLLQEFKLDESAIEADAMLLSMRSIEPLDRMLASAEARFNKALRCIADYRESMAHQLRDAADRITGAKNVLRLSDASLQKSA
jgi:hypothetical protein